MLENRFRKIVSTHQGSQAGDLECLLVKYIHTFGKVKAEMAKLTNKKLQFVFSKIDFFDVKVLN
jgi:hypothetical protein